MHVTSEPPILYVGTPVVLISTRNADGSENLAPMSSAWWLGWRCLLGLGASSQTTRNLRRERECVLNLPSADMVTHVDRLARTTGSNPMSASKIERGYRYEPDKFGVAGLTPEPADTVAPSRVAECPLQLESVVEAVHAVGQDDGGSPARHFAFEVRIQRVHVAPAILADGERDRIDPDRWRPLIMSFQRYYGLTRSELAPSELARIAEASYRSPDVDRAREVAATTSPPGHG